MKNLHKVSLILLVVGGLNWLLTAFNWNLVHLLLGSWMWLENLVYILVGLAAINELAIHKQICKLCDKSMSSAGS